MPKTYEYPLPSELVKHVTALTRARGVEWLARLPSLIPELEEKWEIQIGAPFEKGEFNFVAEAKGEGIDAVLKIAPPFETTEIFAEAEYLRVRNGDGCVRLIDEDRESHAVILERVRPGESMDVHFDSDPFACVEPAIEVMKVLLRRPGRHSDVQYLDEWFDKFRRFRETDFPKTYGERALEIYGRLRQQHELVYYLHGDFHPGNIVTSHRGPFLAIDPKGVIGHLTYDIAVFLNNLHWWQKGSSGLVDNLNTAVEKFAAVFDIREQEIREAAYAYMIIGAWWNFDEMPEHYDNEVALADIWGI